MAIGLQEMHPAVVHFHGVGVKPAGGLNEARGPEIGVGNVGEGARVAADNLRTGVADAAREYASGELAPALATPDRAFDDPVHHGHPDIPAGSRVFRGRTA